MTADEALAYLGTRLPAVRQPELTAIGMELRRLRKLEQDVYEALLRFNRREATSLEVVDDLCLAVDGGM